MGNVFEINRFGKFLKHELVRAYNEYGLSILILGIMPLMLFALVEIFSVLLTKGDFVPFEWCGFVSIFISLIIGAITLPLKVYGPLTDKRFGSEWLMIPASRFEKWLSLIVVTCIVAPLCIAAILFATDGLLSLCFNNTYGASVLTKFNFTDFGQFITSYIEDAFGDETDAKLHLSVAGMSWFVWMSYILFFTLGAIFFKKNKFGLTVLCLFGIGTFSSMLTSILAVTFDWNIVLDNIQIDSLEDFNRIAIWWKLGTILIDLLLPMYLIWLRIKTLKH